MKKTQRKLIFLAFGIALVVGVFLVYQFNSSGLLEGYSIGRFFELSIAPNRLINCSIEDVLQLKYTSGKTINAMTAKDTFIPLIRYDLVDRNTRERFESFPSDIYLTCDIPSGSSISTLVSGSFQIYATASDPSRKDVVIYDKTIIIPEKVMKDNTKIDRKSVV